MAQQGDLQMASLVMEGVSSQSSCDEANRFVKSTSPTRQPSQLKKAAVLPGCVPGCLIEGIKRFLKLALKFERQAEVIAGFTIIRVWIAQRQPFNGLTKIGFRLCKLSTTQQ